jgi:hypothetical protein
MNRKAEAEKLLKDTWGMYHRYHGMDSMLLASPLAIWPPPLRLVFPNNKAEKDVLVCWEVKFNRIPEKEELCRWAASTLDSMELEWKGTNWFWKGTLIFAFLLSQRFIMAF